MEQVQEQNLIDKVNKINKNIDLLLKSLDDRKEIEKKLAFAEEFIEENAHGISYQTIKKAKFKSRKEVAYKVKSEGNGG